LETVFELLPVAYLLGVSVPLAITDIREHRLPNKLVLPAFPVALVSWLVIATTLNQWADFFFAIGAGVLLFALGMVANRFGTLGMGDVKLMGVMALIVGWFSWPLALLVPVVALLLVLISIAIRLIRKIGLPASLPLGPHLLVSFAFLVGIAIIF
jgi:leader peptidase (prepilin peptidase)/N-methyltransferase